MAAKHTVRRNLNLDVLRIVAMLLIVACHAALHIPWLLNVDNIPLQYLPGWKSALAFLVVQYGQVGVSIFFMISGYFLVRKAFRWERVFGTWFQMLCYSVLSFAIVALLLQSVDFPDKVIALFQADSMPHTIEIAFFPFLFNAYWFVTAYMVMLFAAPFVNCLFAHMPRRSIELFIFLLGFLATWKLLGITVVMWTNITYAVLGYAIGGWIRLYGSKSSIPGKPIVLCLIIIVSSVVMTVFNHAAADRTAFTRLFAWETQIKPGIEILPMVIAAAIVMLALDVDLSWIGGVPRVLILRMAAATFGVYLIHENQFWYRVIWPVITGSLPIPQSFPDKLMMGGLIVLLVFFGAGCVAFLLDTLLVHPLTSMITTAAKRIGLRGQKRLRHAGK
ncbi:acyltransferase [Bifidobacterium amazonense]|uniref:Acyltransferase n=1 Tax=Bifidobacterium amazonense TaxID=2809027 RepID=A0ABS9VY21_9BIFI|nr:acyltransferase [Bifidobacterium amazonense]MCH9277023.1 acyltransferase [Bifidobacterium amazonense]